MNIRVKPTEEAIALDAQAQLKEISVVDERNPNPIIKIQRLAYLVLQREDIDVAAQFFVDFGLLVDHRCDDRIYLRGLNCDNHILVLERGPHQYSGVGVVAEPSDLKRLAQECGAKIRKREDPLGGDYVVLEDPNHIRVEVCSGLNKLPPIEKPPLAAWNTGTNHPRLNDPVRYQAQPALVNKLGHTVCSVASIRATVHWYQHMFGLIVSDFQFVKDDPLPVIAFMRCDCENTPVDHHSFGFGSSLELGHVHTAFELDNFEEIALGGNWLAQQCYRHSWGMGRHVLGSQIFDYWRESAGDLFEHYADGDLFDNTKPTGYHYFNAGAQHQWGPNISKNFTGQNRPMDQLKALLKRLPTDDDLSVARLIRLLKAVSSK